MTTVSHRSWFPFILIGLSLSLALLLFAVYAPKGGDAVQSGRVLEWSRGSNPPASTPTQADYETAVQAIVAAYDETLDAKRAYDMLLALWVPSEYKDLHVALVIAFSKFALGNVDEGQRALDALRAAHPWIAGQL